MAWAFIDMMKTDTIESATSSASRVDDDRLAAFHDPAHRLGNEMAKTLGWKHHVAWDTYFVYTPGMQWSGEGVPAPAEWFHQLKDREMWAQTAETEVGDASWTVALAEKSEADPACFATGPDLERGIREALTRAAVGV